MDVQIGPRISLKNVFLSNIFNKNGFIIKNDDDYINFDMSIVYIPLMRLKCVAKCNLLLLYECYRPEITFCGNSFNILLIVAAVNPLSAIVQYIPPRIQFFAHKSKFFDFLYLSIRHILAKFLCFLNYQSVERCQSFQAKLLTKKHNLKLQ